MNDQGFYNHLKDAIAINQFRKKQYSKLSAGKTRKLSTALIVSEKIILPLAKYYDHKARKFNQEGIMVVKEDFVDMNIVAFDNDVPRRSASSKIGNDRIKTLLENLISKIPRKFITNKDLQIVIDNARTTYKIIESIEIEHNVHYAMTKHMIESICFISLNGLKYSHQSSSATLPLSGEIIKLHKTALRNSLWMDRWGNTFHQQNIGILINDMPSIPIF